VDIVTLNNERKKQRVTHLNNFFLDNNLKDAFELAFPQVNSDDSTVNNNLTTNNDTED
jgi:hypothetical protein